MLTAGSPVAVALTLSEYDDQQTFYDDWNPKQGVHNKSSKKYSYSIKIHLSATAMVKFTGQLISAKPLRSFLKENKRHHKGHKYMNMN